MGPARCPRGLGRETVCVELKDIHEGAFKRRVLLLEGGTMSIVKMSVVLATIFLFTACATLEYPVAHRESVGDKIHSLSYTGDLRATHIIQKDAGYWICMEPAPDAAFSYDTEDDLDLALISTGDREEGKTSTGSEDLPLAGRTSYVLLARELNYRICEMAANTNATFDQYFKAYQANLAVIQQVATGESQNISHKTQVTISTGAQSALSYAQTDQGLPPESMAAAGGAGAATQAGGSSPPKVLTQGACEGSDLNGKWEDDGSGNPYCDDPNSYGDLTQKTCIKAGGQHWDATNNYCYKNKQP